MWKILLDQSNVESLDNTEAAALRDLYLIYPPMVNMKRIARGQLWVRNWRGS